VGTLTPLELEDEQRYWRSRNLEYGEERRLLTLRAAKLVEQIQILEAPTTRVAGHLDPHS